MTTSAFITLTLLALWILLFAVRPLLNLANKHLESVFHMLPGKIRDVSQRFNAQTAFLLCLFVIVFFADYTLIYNGLTIFTMGDSLSALAFALLIVVVEMVVGEFVLHEDKIPKKLGILISIAFLIVIVLVKSYINVMSEVGQANVNFFDTSNVFVFLKFLLIYMLLSSVELFLGVKEVGSSFFRFLGLLILSFVLVSYAIGFVVVLLFPLALWRFIDKLRLWYTT